MNKHSTILNLIQHYIDNDLDKRIETPSFVLIRDGAKSAVMHMYDTKREITSTYVIRPSKIVTNTIDTLFSNSVTLWKYNTSTEVDILNYKSSLCIDVNDSEMLFQYSTVLSAGSVELLKIANEIVEYTSAIISVYDNYRDMNTAEDIIKDYNKFSPVLYNP